MRLQAALLLACCGLVFGKPSSPSGFSNWLTLDPYDKFNVSWTAEEDKITFEVTCKTTGWVGLGFSPSGSMADADIIVAWAADDGTSHLLDMFATTNSLPTKDASQDVKLLSAVEANGVTTVQFERKLDTCDENGDNIIASSTTRLIYAYQTSDPANNEFTGADYHGSTNRGSKNIYLLDSKTGVTPVSLPDDVQTFDFKINNYNVPEEATTYYCAFIAPPELEAVHHMISIEPLISAGNEGVVHHILLFACYGVSDELIRNNSKTEGVCGTAEMPEFSDNCSTTIHGWAVGGGTFYFPEKAGYPLGGPDGSAPNYFQIQMHYDNPEGLNTFVDSSGLRVTYTPTVREHEAAVFPVGLVEGIAVPPAAEKFKIVSYCDGSCTNQFLPEEGIEIYGYLLHTHLLGTAIHVEWFRDGKNVGYLAFDNSYDFNFQETRHMETNKKMLPGDSLKITCTYNDGARDFVTYGGEGTTEEMCLAYLFYYPRANVAMCSSFPTLYSNRYDPVYAELSVNASERGTIRSLDDVSVWTEDTVTVLQKGYDETPHVGVCYQENFVAYEEMYTPINKDGYPEMEESKPSKCSSGEGEPPSSAGSIRANLVSFLFLFVVVFY
ncbi:DBH-like monooxygenase protein 1 [Watersipora subatra]|uniref:DBH-like monooxygenase protein 1 n=1 Tax=Watersipora subatra TaxID=2589382 RepID=UPI00355AFE9F